VSTNQANRVSAVSLAPSAHLRRRFLYQKSMIGLMIIATSLTIIITVGIVLSLLPTTIRLLSSITTQVF